MKHMVFASLVALVGACSTPTGATCPTSNAPSYDSFGHDYFAKYCTDCHSSTATNRHDAPTDLNFDTEADVKSHASDIDEAAASGPNATNAAMPALDNVVKSAPTADERTMLGQFLACENASN